MYQTQTSYTQQIIPKKAAKKKDIVVYKHYLSLSISTSVAGCHSGPKVHLPTWIIVGYKVIYSPP